MIMGHRRTSIRRAIGFSVLVAALSTCISALEQSPASAAVTCNSTETTKFVYDSTYGSYFGDRGALFTSPYAP